MRIFLRIMLGCLLFLMFPFALPLAVILLCVWILVEIAIAKRPLDRRRRQML